MTDSPDRSLVAAIAPQGTIAHDVRRERGEASRHDRTPDAASADGEIGHEDVWQEAVKRILKRLGTSAAGLDTAEVQQRLRSYGPNDASTVKRSPLPGFPN
jgi:hypothetical protein